MLLVEISVLKDFGQINLGTFDSFVILQKLWLQKQYHQLFTLYGLDFVIQVDLGRIPLKPCQNKKG